MSRRHGTRKEVAFCHPVLKCMRHDRQFAVTKKPDTSDLAIDHGSSYIHFYIDGMKANSVTANADLPEMHAVGASVSFFIEVFKMESAQEVKLTLCDDVTLRWRKNGAAVNWVVWTGRGFKSLGKSKILPESGKHSVTYVRGADSFIIFEDGDQLKPYKSPKAKIVPKFYMKTTGRKAVLDMNVTRIQIHNGVSTPIVVV